MIDIKTDFAALLQFLQTIYAEKIPFNRLLELQIMSLEEDNVCIKLKMKEKFVRLYLL